MLYEVITTLTVTNTGPTDLDTLQLNDPLESIFGTAGELVGVEAVDAGGLTPNPNGYNGLDVTDLLAGTDTLSAGATATVTFDLRFVCYAPATFTNTATATAGGRTAEDLV